MAYKSTANPHNTNVDSGVYLRVSDQIIRYYFLNQPPAAQDAARKRLNDAANRYPDSDARRLRDAGVYDAPKPGELARLREELGYLV